VLVPATDTGVAIGEKAALQVIVGIDDFHYPAAFSTSGSSAAYPELWLSQAI
jgi:hypothetical protein